MADDDYKYQRFNNLHRYTPDEWAQWEKDHPDEARYIRIHGGDVNRQTERTLARWRDEYYTSRDAGELDEWEEPTEEYRQPTLQDFRRGRHEKPEDFLKRIEGRAAEINEVLEQQYRNADTLRGSSSFSSLFGMGRKAREANAMLQEARAFVDEVRRAGQATGGRIIADEDNPEHYAFIGIQDEQGKIRIPGKEEFEKRQQRARRDVIERHGGRAEISLKMTHVQNEAYKDIVSILLSYNVDKRDADLIAKEKTGQLATEEDLWAYKQRRADKLLDINPRIKRAVEEYTREAVLPQQPQAPTEGGREERIERKRRSWFGGSDEPNQEAGGNQGARPQSPSPNSSSQNMTRRGRRKEKGGESPANPYGNQEIPPWRKTTEEMSQWEIDNPEDGHHVNLKHLIDKYNYTNPRIEFQDSFDNPAPDAARPGVGVKPGPKRER